MSGDLEGYTVRRALDFAGHVPDVAAVLAPDVAQQLADQMPGQQVALTDGRIVGRVTAAELTPAGTGLLVMIDLAPEAERLADTLAGTPSTLGVGQTLEACQECRAGKHDSCNGYTWNWSAYRPAPCPCETARHGKAGDTNG